MNCLTDEKLKAFFAKEDQFASEKETVDYLIVDNLVEFLNSRDLEMSKELL